MTTYEKENFPLSSTFLPKLKEDESKNASSSSTCYSSNEMMERDSFLDSSETSANVLTTLSAGDLERPNFNRSTSFFNFIVIRKMKRWFTYTFPFPFLTFLLPYLAYSALYCARKPFSLVKFNIQENLGITALSLGYIDASFFIAYAIGQLTLPFYLEKKFKNNIRFSLLILFSLISMTVYALAYAYTDMSFLILCGINGLLNAPVFTLLVNYMMPFIPPDSRGFFFGLWITSQQTGAIASSVISTVALHFFHWRSVFRFPAFLTFPVGILIWKFLPLCNDKDWRNCMKKKEHSANKATPVSLFSSETALVDEVSPGVTHELVNPSDVEGSNRKVQEPILSQNSLFHLLRGLLQNPLASLDVFCVSLAYFCVKAIRYSFLNWFPLFLSETHFIATTAIPSFIMLFDLGGILGMLITGYLTDTIFKGKKAMFIAFSCLATGFFCICFVLHGESKVIPFLLFVSGVFLAGPDALLATVLCQDICERWAFGQEYPVLIYGIVNGMGSAGVVLQGYFTALMSVSYGWDSVFAAYCLVLVIAAFSLYPLSYRKINWSLPVTA